MQNMPEGITEGKECGLWPTPQRIDEDFCRMTVIAAEREGKQPHVTTELIKRFQRRFPSPSFGEALMGFPIGWTKAGAALETAKFQQWLDSHGKH